MPAPSAQAQRVLGRYSLYAEIASGGMATVHFGRLAGPVGFSRTVAIKRLHPQYAKDPEFVAMFLDEARVAARIRHPNVVPTLDVVAAEGELFLVMDYVEGESLSRIIHATRRARQTLPIGHAVGILAGALHGLHAAHEATSERGEPLLIVHRDISPQNILVGVDGAARVLDFGVAKAAGRLQTTREGQLKGKMAYMAPEQLQGGKLDRKVDVFAAGVVLWEALTGHRLFKGENDAEVFGKVIYGRIEPPSSKMPDIPPELDAIVLRALSRAPAERFETAQEMARALERAVPVVPSSEIGEFVRMIAEGSLAARARQVAEIEGSGVHPASSSVPVAASAPVPEESSESLSGATRMPVPVRAGTRVIAREAPALVEAGEVSSSTQLSSGSISQPTARAPRPSAPLFVAVLAGSFLAVAAVLLVFRSHAAPPAETSFGDPTAPVTQATSTAAPPAPAPPPPPDTTPLPNPPIVPVDPASPAAPPTASIAAPAHAVPPRPVPHHPAAKATSGISNDVLNGVLGNRH